MKPERRRELDFLLRIKNAIYVVGGAAHLPHSSFITSDLQADVFTLLELIKEGVFVINNFDPVTAILCIKATVDICICNGYNMTLVNCNNTIEISLDYESVAEFIEFYSTDISTQDKEQ